MTPNPWLTVCALSLGPVVGNGFARFGYALLLPAMKLDMVWSFTQAGWINTAHAIGYLVGAVLSPSLERPMSMISPMIDEIGPICGSTPVGSWLWMRASRSATCWRLR